MKITFRTATLLAALECSAKKDIRYYLVGVSVQITKPDVGMVYGTDGHVLFAGQLFYSGECEPFKISIPSTAIKGLKGELVDLEFDGEHYLLGGARFVPVDATFPDVDRVIPDIDASVPQTPGYYNPDLLVRAQSALARYTGGKGISPLIQRGEDSAVMHSDTNHCLVVVMPTRQPENVAFVGFNRDFM